MVTGTAQEGLPPAPNPEQKYQRRLLGQQDKGLVAKRRHQSHKMQQNKGMLGEIPSKRTKRGSEGHKRGTYVTGTELWER